MKGKQSYRTLSVRMYNLSVRNLIDDENHGMDVVLETWRHGYLVWNRRECGWNNRWR